MLPIKNGNISAESRVKYAEVQRRYKADGQFLEDCKREWKKVVVPYLQANLHETFSDQVDEELRGWILVDKADGKAQVRRLVDAISEPAPAGESVPNLVDVIVETPLAPTGKQVLATAEQMMDPKTYSVLEDAVNEATRTQVQHRISVK